MGALNSKNTGNQDMDCYDLNEFHDFNESLNNMPICMQCQNFGTPCTCQQTNGYDDANYNYMSSSPIYSQTCTPEPLPPSPPPFYMPPATCLVSTPPIYSNNQVACTNNNLCTCECCTMKLCDLSECEIKKLRRLFSEHSGFDRKLSFPEFLKIIRSNPCLTGFQCNLNLCHLKKCFDAGDLNCDGLINFDQFLYAFCLTRPDQSCTTPAFTCYQPNCFQPEPCCEPVEYSQRSSYQPIEVMQPVQVFDQANYCCDPNPCQPTTNCQQIQPPIVCQQVDPSCTSYFDTCEPFQSTINLPPPITLPPLPREIERMLHRVPKVYSTPYIPRKSYQNSYPLLPDDDIERLLQKSSLNSRHYKRRRYEI